MSTNFPVIPKLAFSGKHQCKFCGKVWIAAKLKDIRYLDERVEPGEPMPSGECPRCGDLCHPVESSRPAIFVAVKGGVVQGAKANIGIDFNVFDQDDLEENGMTSEQMEAEWEKITKGCPKEVF